MVHPCLPQTVCAAEREKRSNDLKKNRILYVCESPENIPGVAFIKGPVDRLPGQTPSFCWRFKVVTTAAKSILNFAGFKCQRMFNASRMLGKIMVNQHDSEEVKKALENVDSMKDIQVLAKEALNRYEKKMLKGTDFVQKSPIFSPYRDMFRILRRPEIADNFLYDVIFARLRVAGYNRCRCSGCVPSQTSHSRSTRLACRTSATPWRLRWARGGYTRRNSRLLER